MIIEGTTDILEKIEDSTKICIFWDSPSVTDRPRDGAREAGPEPGPGPGGRAETGTTTTTKRPGISPGIRLTVAITILKCYRAIATGYLPAAAVDYE